MAIIEASLSFYVDEGYVATGYVEGEPFSSASSISILAGKLVEASTSLDASFTKTADSGVSVIAILSLDGAMNTTMNIVGILRPEIYFDTSTTLYVDATTSIEALYSVGMLTSWSALGSPVTTSPLAVESTFTGAFTSNNQINAIVDLSMSTDLNVDNLYIRNASVDLTGEFDLYAISGPYFTNSKYDYPIVITDADKKYYNRSAYRPTNANGYLYSILDQATADMFNKDVSENWTVDFAFKPTVAQDDTLVYITNSANNYTVLTVGRLSDGRVYFKLNDSLSPRQKFISVNPIAPIDTWTDVAVSKNGFLRLMINGVSVTMSYYLDDVYQGDFGAVGQSLNSNPVTSDCVVRIRPPEQGYLDQFRLRTIGTSGYTPSATLYDATNDVYHLQFEDPVGAIYAEYNNEPVSAALSLDSAFTQTTDTTKYVGGAIALDCSFTQTTQGNAEFGSPVTLSSSFTTQIDSDLFEQIDGAADYSFTSDQNTWAANLIGFTAPEYSWDELVSWDTWLGWQETGLASLDAGTFTTAIDSDLFLLHKAELALSSTLTQTSSSWVEHYTGYTPNSEFDQSTTAINAVEATSAFDANFATSVVAQTEHQADLTLNGAFNAQLDVLLVTGTSFITLGEFTQSTQGLVDHEAAHELSAEFVTTIDGTTDILGSIDLIGSFTQTTQSKVSHWTGFTTSAEFATAIDSVYQSDSSVYLDSSFTTQIDTSVEYIGVVDLSAEFNQVTDYEGIYAGSIDYSAEFDQSTTAKNIIGAELSVSITFKQITDAQTVFGAVEIDGTIQFTTEITAKNQIDARTPVDFTFSIDPIDYTYFAAGSLAVDAAFSLSNRGDLIPISRERTLFICQETRTLYPLQESRVLAA